MALADVAVIEKTPSKQIQIAHLGIIVIRADDGHVLLAAIQANFVEDVVAAGERDGDHQDDRGIADYQAERSEECAEFVRPQSLKAEAERLAVEHQAPIFRSSASACDLGGSLGVKGAFRYRRSRRRASSRLRPALM